MFSIPHFQNPKRPLLLSSCHQDPSVPVQFAQHPLAQLGAAEASVCVTHLCGTVAPLPLSLPWQGSAGTGGLWQHTGPLASLCRTVGREIPLPPNPFVHVSKPCSASSSLPVPRPLVMLSAVNLCPGNPQGAQSLLPVLGLRGPRAAAAVLPVIGNPAIDGKGSWDGLSSLSRLPLAQSFSWLLHSVLGWSLPLPPALDLNSEGICILFLAFAVITLNGLSTRESVYSWLGELQGLFQL